MKTAVIPRSLLNQGRIRFEGKFYLNDDSLNSMKVESHKDKCILLSSIAEVFNPPIFKRQFCKETVNSVQYFQSSDVPVNTDCSEVFVYKPQVDKIGALVNKDDILVTGFGTIGNVRIVSRRVAGSCFANNVCRIRSHNNKLTGFYYAFLASKYGRSQLNKNASGAVVRYIEAPGIKKTLVPVFPEEMQKEIDQLIRDAASLRDKAAELFDKAKSILQESIGVTFDKTNGYRTASTSIKDIRSSLKMRLDPPVFVNDGVKMLERISDKTQPLSICNAIVRRPGIFKRCYVLDGLPYIKGSEIFNTNPFVRCENLSRTKTPMQDEMALKDGQILVTCAGSVGQVKLITKEYEKKKSIGSQDIIRIDTSDSLYTPEYLFTYLSLPMTFDYMQSMKYGAVIERIEPFHVESIPVVIPSKELSATITDIIREYKDCLYRAFCKEESAISMVETEIESWDKNKSKK